MVYPGLMYLILHLGLHFQALQCGGLPSSLSGSVPAIRTAGVESCLLWRKRSTPKPPRRVKLAHFIKDEKVFIICVFFDLIRNFLSNFTSLRDHYRKDIVHTNLIWMNTSEWMNKRGRWLASSYPLPRKMVTGMGKKEKCTKTISDKINSQKTNIFLM